MKQKEQESLEHAMPRRGDGGREREGGNHRETRSWDAEGAGGDARGREQDSD